MFKGTTGPQSGRTSRSQAEKLGTDPEGFVKAPEYDAQGGHPITPAMPSQTYKAEQLKPGTDSKPIDPSTPFVLKP